jgi:hypothetical protein
MEEMPLYNGNEDQPASGISEMMQGAVEAPELDIKRASLPRLLLMGPRRGGKTSIQVSGVVLFCAVVFLEPLFVTHTQL